VDRYQTEIFSWHLTVGSNLADVLSLGEVDLVLLTLQIVEAVRRVSSQMEVTVGIAQPWGEYAAAEERTYTPFLFADMLLRSGVPIAALDLEVVMAVTPRGSYCRSLLAFSQLLDHYASLGVPLQVTLAYPAAASADDRSDEEYLAGAGYWRGGIDPAAQADWAGEFAALALCKPYVRAVYWAHLSDTGRHQFPHCGLADSENRPRPVMQRLRELRERFLA
jgi:hypothetical protein